jgi:phage terminase large subunit
MKRDRKEFEWTVADKAAAGDRAVLREEGIGTVPSGGKVQDGIQTVHRFLDLRPDGFPGLYVSSDCKNTITTGQLYHYPENVINMDNPVKEDDDPWDCIRYFLHKWTRGRVRMYMPVAPKHENSKYHGVNKWIREA